MPVAVSTGHIGRVADNAKAADCVAEWVLWITAVGIYAAPRHAGQSTCFHLGAEVAGTAVCIKGTDGQTELTTKDCCADSSAAVSVLPALIITTISIHKLRVLRWAYAQHVTGTLHGSPAGAAHLRLAEATIAIGYVDIPVAVIVPGVIAVFRRRIDLTLAHTPTSQITHLAPRLAYTYGRCALRAGVASPDITALTLVALAGPPIAPLTCVIAGPHLAAAVTGPGLGIAPRAFPFASAITR